VAEARKNEPKMAWEEAKQHLIKSGKIQVYQIVVSKSALKDLQLIPAADVKKIVLQIDGLSSNPRPYGCKKTERKSGRNMAHTPGRLQNYLFDF
jgi:hypothetical protein